MRRAGPPLSAGDVSGMATLVWKHPVLTGLVILMFTPPFFPLLVYFSPLLVSTALCVAALVSVGSQMDKIKAEGGAGQLQVHLGQDRGVGAWVERDNSRPDIDASRRDHRSSSSGNDIDAAATWIGRTGREDPFGGNHQGLETAPWQFQETDSAPPVAEETEEDRWEAWVKEYEARPGWGELEEEAPPRDPAATTRLESIPNPVFPPPLRPPPPAVALPPPPPPHEEESAPPVVNPHLAVVHPRLPPLLVRAAAEPREHGDAVRQVDWRHAKPVEESVTAKNVEMGSSKAHVSDLQALESIEKLLYMEKMRAPMKVPAAAAAGLPKRDVPAEVLLHLKTAGLGDLSVAARARARVVPVKEPHAATLIGVASSEGKGGYTVEASEKNRNKIAVATPDISGETPLLRHLKTSRSEKQQARNAAYSPLPLRSSPRSSSGMERVLPPPEFSPRLLHSLQPLPPKDFSPRMLQSLNAARLENPVERIPQRLHSGMPERNDHRAMSAEAPRPPPEVCEEKHGMDVKVAEVGVKLSSHSRRRTHAHWPILLSDAATTSQRRHEDSRPSTPKLSLPVKAVAPATSSSNDDAVHRTHEAAIATGLSTLVLPQSRRRRHSTRHSPVAAAVATPPRRMMEGYVKPPQLPAAKDATTSAPPEDYVSIEREISVSEGMEVKPPLDASPPPHQETKVVHPEEGVTQWGRSHSARRASPRKSRRRVEPRRVVSQDNDMFSLRKSASLRNGQTIRYIDSSSDERESVTPRASRRTTEGTNKPLVWRSRSLQTREESD